MQVGARQLRLLGDIGHLGSGIALLGEHLLGRQQDFLYVLAADLYFGVGHRVPDLRR